MKEVQEITIRRSSPGRCVMMVDGRNDITITGHPRELAETLFFAVKGMVDDLDDAYGRKTHEETG